MSWLQATYIFLLILHVSFFVGRDTNVFFGIVVTFASQAMLLQLLDQHCLFSNSHLEPKEPESAYDFVYLPIDFK